MIKENTMIKKLILVAVMTGSKMKTLLFSHFPSREIADLEEIVVKSRKPTWRDRQPSYSEFYESITRKQLDK